MGRPVAQFFLHRKGSPDWSVRKQGTSIVLHHFYAPRQRGDLTSATVGWMIRLVHGAPRWNAPVQHQCVRSRSQSMVGSLVRSARNCSAMAAGRVPGELSPLKPRPWARRTKQNARRSGAGGPAAVCRSFICTTCRA